MKLILTIVVLIVFSNSVFAQEKTVYVVGPTEFTTWTGAPGVKNMQIKYLAGAAAMMAANKAFWGVDELSIEDLKVQPNEAINYFELHDYRLSKKDMFEQEKVRFPNLPGLGSLVRITKNDASKICELHMLRRDSNNPQGIGTMLYISLVGCYQLVQP